FILLAPLLTAACVFHILRICFLEVPLQAGGHVSIGAQATILAICVNVATSIPLFYLMGIICVCWGTITAHLCGLVFSFYRLRMSIKDIIDLPYLGVSMVVALGLFGLLPGLGHGAVAIEICLLMIGTVIYFLAMIKIRNTMPFRSGV